MTTTPVAAPDLPLIAHKRACRLPSPTLRRAIRDTAKVSRHQLGQAVGISGSSIAFYERPDGFTPRPAVAVRYRKELLELLTWIEETGAADDDWIAQAYASFGVGRPTAAQK